MTVIASHTRVSVKHYDRYIVLRCYILLSLFVFQRNTNETCYLGVVAAQFDWPL